MSDGAGAGEVEKKVPDSAAARTDRRPPIVIDNESIWSLDHFSIPPQYADSLESILIPRGMVIDRVQRLAQDIRVDYPDSVPHLICILKGAYDFFNVLTNAMRMEHLFSKVKALPFTFDFARLQSYEGTDSTGKVDTYLMGIDESTLRGRDVILVEDIVDTGLSMKTIIPKLEAFGPRSVNVCTLLEKRTARSCGFVARYAGFSIPDKFVVGFGMDYNQVFRELEHIGIINDHGIKKYKDVSFAVTD